MPKKATTLIELIVSVILLALIMAGLANIFVSARRYIAYSRQRIQAMEANKIVLENLNNFVRQDTWDNATNLLCNNTSAGCSPTTDKPGGNTTLNNIRYEAYFDVMGVSIGSGPVAPEVRKVKLKMNWTEPY